MGDLSQSIKIFANLFKCSRSGYVVHVPPFTHEESGKVKASKVFYKKAEGENKSEIWRKLYEDHFTGSCGLAVYPVLKSQKISNAVYFAIIDIDIYSENFNGIIKILKRDGFKFSAFRSKSGGLHIYFLFEQDEDAQDAVLALQSIVKTYNLDKIYSKNGKSKVEIFPKQTDSQASGNCLFLPYFDAVHGSKQTLQDGEDGVYTFEQAVEYAKSQIISVSKIRDILSNLPYNDAPKCVQSVLMSGALGANEGRNDFLFHAAIYLKKKYKDNFGEYLLEMNERLASPLEEEEVLGIAKSVEEHSYDTYPCKKEPACSYCDKRVCATKEYGVGKEKGNRFTGASCWGELTKYMALEPYYIWKVQVNPDEEFRNLRIDSVSDLQNQYNVQKLCWRDLDWAPHIVKTNDWVDIVNKAMEGIQSRRVEVAIESDTSSAASMRMEIANFLVTTTQTTSMEFLRAGCLIDKDNKIYFTTDAFMSYLAMRNYRTKGMNIREELVSAGCADCAIDLDGKQMNVWQIDKNNALMSNAAKKKEAEVKIDWLKSISEEDEDEDEVGF